MELTKIIELLKHLNKDLVVLIAVEFVGGWIYKNKKLVFDYERLYNKIPRVLCSTSSRFVYSRGFKYMIERDCQILLPITIHKSYIISYFEICEYKEHQYFEEINIEENKKTIRVNKEYDDLTYTYALDYHDVILNRYETLHTEM